MTSIDTTTPEKTAIDSLTLNQLDRGALVIKDVLKTLTDQPGVYRMINSKGDILYIGKAKNLKKRVVAYTRTDLLPTRLKRMVSETTHMEIVITHTEIEALLLEANLIRKIQPRYNILLKDDKSFPYILITKGHPFPRIVKHRGPQTIPGHYFGPFANVLAVDEAILVVQKIFNIRNCTDSYFSARKRPCLQYHIKRCSAPCVNKIDHQHYDENIHIAKQFLQGKTDYVQKILSDKMQGYSDALEFEKAKNIRDTLRLMTDIQTRQRINVSGIKDADILGLVQSSGLTCVQVFFYRYGRNFGTESFFIAHAQEENETDILSAFILQFYVNRTPPPLILLSHAPTDMQLIMEAFKERSGHSHQLEVPKIGIKADLVQHAIDNAKEAITRKINHSDNFHILFTRLKELAQLSTIPKRIEVYDNSHLQGSHACGVMIVANQHGFDKKSYRKFNPKDAQSNDDFGMMREFLKRRLSHISDWGEPDVLIIDGGAGQLSSVEEILKELKLNIATIAIAKGPERNAGKERLFITGKEPICLEHNDPLLHFLQNIRDEAHRFAIGTHRSKRQKTLTHSRLDDIPGIGTHRKKQLLLHFGSAKNVANAAIADLERVEGISSAVAKTIYDYYH